MPESKKRKKKPQEESKPVYKNPLKKRWGKIIVVILVFGFLLGTVAGTIFALIQMFMD